MTDTPEDRPPHIDPAQWAAACAVSNALIPTAHKVAADHGPIMAVAGCIMAAANVAARGNISAEVFRSTVLRTLSRMVRENPANESKPH
jgi:hypothetical protein